MSKFMSCLIHVISFNIRNSLAYLQKSCNISNRILFFSSVESEVFPISFIILAGLPAAKTLGGRLFETTDPPPTITFSSIVNLFIQYILKSLQLQFIEKCYLNKCFLYFYYIDSKEEQSIEKFSYYLLRINEF